MNVALLRYIKYWTGAHFAWSPQRMERKYSISRGLSWQEDANSVYRTRSAASGSLQQYHHKEKLCPCVQQASWEAQVIKLCEIWAKIYPIFNLVIKTGESRGSSAPATIPSESRSKATRRTRAGRRRHGSYCGRPGKGVEVKLRVLRSPAPTSKF
jgi:hypothetical protein